MTKYKYYFKKERNEIVKDILRWLVIVGAIYIAASSPYFIINILRAFRKGNRYGRKDVYNAFYRLRRGGYLEIHTKGHQIYIFLTEKGRQRAGWFQINHLEIKKPKRWDGKWRVFIFDIPHVHRLKREALRGFLKRLNFFPLQKSVWVSPYECRDELELLKDFFGLSREEARLIVSDDIGDNTQLKKYFGL